jgi:sialate O-acetylesterase
MATVISFGSVTTEVFLGAKEKAMSTFSRITPGVRRGLTGLTIGVLALGSTGATWADVTVPTMFSDHAVLQRNMLVPVWGTASPGEEVTVEFHGQLKSTTADGDGTWMVFLDRMLASSAPDTMTITGNNTIVLTDVQVGEVWLGSGQSNMQRALSGDCDATAAIAEAGDYNMRFFNVTANGGNVSSTVWEVSDAASAPAMSAVHFFFGRHLAQQMPDVPIGLISSAVSATAIEKWSTCAGSGGLYTGQIVPLQPYALRGATWYQGEWDARGSQSASKYYWQLPCLIDEWRADWGQGIFPFYVVQMPKMGINSIHIVRDAELQTALDDPKVEMIVTIDQPGSDVHPPCKEPFGVRLAMLARKFEYGQDLVARSPTYNAAASYVADTAIGVVFDNVAGGLQSSGGPLAEWEIAGADGRYFAASAVIVGTDAVEVWSSSVPSPVSARFAFSTNPVANNLVNSEGLPASPIREVAPGVSEPMCGDWTCDPGEDQCDCAVDCGAPPSTEAVCDDGVDEDCDGGADCSDPTGDCDADPACDCLGKRAACSADSECCSSKCRGGKCR